MNEIACGGGVGQLAPVETVPPAYATSQVRVALAEKAAVTVTDQDCNNRAPHWVSGDVLVAEVRRQLVAGGFVVVAPDDKKKDIDLRVSADLIDCMLGGGQMRLTAEVQRDGSSIDNATAIHTLEYNNVTPWANDVVNALMRSTRIAGQLRPANRGPSAIAGGALALHTATKVLVLPLRPVGNVSSETCRLLTGIMLSQLDGVKNLKAVGGEDVQAALGLEKQKEALGCNNLTCMAEIGGALGVDLVMYGELGTLGAKYNVNLSLIRARDASVAARASKLTDQSEEVMANELPQLVADVVARLNREPG